MPPEEPSRSVCKRTEEEEREKSDFFSFGKVCVDVSFGRSGLDISSAFRDGAGGLAGNTNDGFSIFGLGWREGCLIVSGVELVSSL